MFVCARQPSGTPIQSTAAGSHSPSKINARPVCLTVEVLQERLMVEAGTTPARLRQTIGIVENRRIPMKNMITCSNLLL